LSIPLLPVAAFAFFTPLNGLHCSLVLSFTSSRPALSFAASNSATFFAAFSPLEKVAIVIGFLVVVSSDFAAAATVVLLFLLLLCS
jgi:hypothetical protein